MLAYKTLQNANVGCWQSLFSVLRRLQDAIRNTGRVCHLLTDVVRRPCGTILLLGDTARLDFYLSYFSDTTSLVNAIRNLAYLGGSANMTDGLRMARTLIFNAANGDRPDVPNVIIVVTNSHPVSETAVLHEVLQIKDLGITIIAVGITDSVSD